MNVILIHSYNADTLEGFAKDIQSFCNEKNIKYDAPVFPIREKANYLDWQNILNNYKLDKNTIVIAHSLGTHFIIKYLAKNNIHIKKYISVAGFLNYKGREDLERIIKDFEPTDDELEKCQCLIDERYSIYSDNDQLNNMEKLELYARKLNAEKILLKDHGHFSPKNGIFEIKKIKEIIDI